MKYKRTLQLFAIFLACELYAMLFAALVYSCGRDGERGSGAVTACSSARPSGFECESFKQSNHMGIKALLLLPAILAFPGYLHGVAALPGTLPGPDTLYRDSTYLRVINEGSTRLNCYLSYPQAAGVWRVPTATTPPNLPALPVSSVPHFPTV